MKSQHRPKPTGNGSSLSGGTPSPAINGHRRSGSKHNGFKENTSSAAETSANNRLVDLLTRASGRLVVATVSSGAKYLGLLLAVDLSPANGSALSVVLAKPSLVAKSLLNEKSNSDDSLPNELIIQAKDLIDIDVKFTRESGLTPPLEDKKPKAEKLPEMVNDTVKKSTVDEPAEKSVEKPAEKPEEAPVDKNAKKPVGVPEKTGERKIKLAEILAVSPAQQHNVGPTQSIPLSELTAPSKFKTDADISSGFQVRERELQRWVADDDTSGLTLEDSSNGAWDQFKVNEEKFGVESTYDEHLYTTRIDKTAEGYQQRLERAERLAFEIEGQSTSDRHVLEERGVQVDDSGLDEEDKYSGVVGDPVDTRGVELMAALRNASISKDQSSAAPAAGKYATPRQRAAQYHNDPAIVSSSATQTAQAPDATAPSKHIEATDGKSPASKPSSIPPKPPTAAHGESFRLNAKSEINALKEFSANFKVPHRMPNDLLPILAKDKVKQDEILRKLDSPNNTVSPLETKKDVKSFKLNPKAAAFTPLPKPAGQQSPVPPKAFSKSPNNPSPRMHNQRQYSGSSGSTTVKRHHQISAADFFGGQNKIPTAASQKEKIERVKSGFNLFATAKRNRKDETIPLVLEKAFHTPPTWDSTVEENYEKLLLLQVLPAGRLPAVMPSPGMPFMPSPAMVPGTPQRGAGGFPGAPNRTFSPHMQSQASMAAQFQQQQFQAALLYQQFQGGVPPGQPQMMYDNQFMPPGFIPQGFVSPGSPAGGNMMMGSNPYGGQVHNQGHQGNYNQHQGRRYNNNQKPRGSQS